MACHTATQGACCTASAHTSKPQHVIANLPAAHTGIGSATPPKTVPSAPSAAPAWARSTAAARPSCTLAATPTQPPSTAWQRGRATHTRSTSGGGWQLAELHRWQPKAGCGRASALACQHHPPCMLSLLPAPALGCGHAFWQPPRAAHWLVLWHHCIVLMSCYADTMLT